MDCGTRVVCIAVTLVALLCAVWGPDGVAAKKAKSVTTVIDAKWEVTPLVLEMAEYLAEESTASFWRFVDAVCSLGPPLIDSASEKASYDRAAAQAAALLSVAQLSLLKLALALHIHSPRIQMYAQMAAERGADACPTAADIGGRLVCTPEEVSAALTVAMKEWRQQPETFRLDHHYPGSENRSVVAVLYGELGTPEMAAFHNLLKEAAKRGEVDYIIRHHVKERPNRKVRLSGYGVELQMKSTEYKVQDDTKVEGGDGGAGSQEDDDADEEVGGFNFKRLKELYPEQAPQLERMRQSLLESSSEMAPLKVWQFQELSLQAAQRVLDAPREEQLHVLTHVAQNFPLQARSLVKTVVSAQLKTEMKTNQEAFSAQLNLQPSDAALFVNGLYFDLDVVDAITVLEAVRSELRVMEGLHAVGVRNKRTLKSLLALDLSAATDGGTGAGSGGGSYALDIRDSAVQWVNDLETDKKYRRWSPSLMDLLRPMFPGMLRSVKRNLFNLVIICDPSKRAIWPVVKLAESFYVHSAPLRIGLVFALDNATAIGLQDGGVALLNAFNYVAETAEPHRALSFITDVYASIKDTERDVEPADVSKQLKASYPSADADEVLGSDTDYDTGRKLAREFIQRSGLHTTPQVLLNGVPLPTKSLTADDFEETVLTEIMHQTPALQKAVYRGDLSDSHNVLDYIMDQPNIMPRLNERVLTAAGGHYLDLAAVEGGAGDGGAEAGEVAMLIGRLSYAAGRHLGEAAHLITHWLVTDLAEAQGRDLLSTALQHMRISGRIRVTLIVNPGADSDRLPASALNRYVLAALESLPADVAAARITQMLADYEAIGAGEKTLADYDIPSGAAEALDRVGSVHRAFVRSALGWSPGERGLVTNGRVIGPLGHAEEFNADDFALLERYSLSAHVNKIHGHLTAAASDDADSDPVTSDVLMKTVSLLVARPQSRSRFDVSAFNEEHSVVKLSARSSSEPAFDIAVVVDPVSRGAQKAGPLLTALHEVLNCDIRVFFNCVEKNSDMPLKSFYRFVLETEPHFLADGRAAGGPMARFSNMPAAPLLTQNMHVPDNWLVEVIASPYDLDNIRLEEVDSVVHSQFELEHLLLEGHCFEATVGNPPRGLQMTLGTESRPVQVDTIVMANLGYFQLKANPGAWLLRLRQGRSADIFDIVSHEGSDTPANSTDIKVLIGSFRPHVLKLKVAKKADKMDVDLLGDEEHEQAGLWNSFASTFTGTAKDDDSGKDEPLNIFSVASGHLYERFLRIMMLSVLKHTESPVKFWFLKNYLSPTFKDFLPQMSRRYGFQYELVQYKWPRWLHQQTEKQRTIWGYKILFLDVLFPLHVKKIIFVDADQVVRADLKELVDLNLGGAPYGYTPFCESRTEMDGFRFWKTGYWRNHLQGRRYHISALYVVDLKRFRRIAAGDRLRGQYQALSQDPNSLSNLDQDLPNNMIHQVAIKSLPQDWLWCETWCDNASKRTAKTIDLCNNPLTKEAKLSAAMRIVPEWKDYDAEIKALQLRLGETEGDEEEVVEEQPAVVQRIEKSDLAEHSEL